LQKSASSVRCKSLVAVVAVAMQRHLAKSPGDPRFAANGTVAETPKHLRRRPRTLVTGGRCSFVVLLAFTGHAVCSNDRRGVLVENRRRKAGLFETQERQRLAGSAQHRKRKPEQRARQRVKVGEAT
jgi:hypothetical protein